MRIWFACAALGPTYARFFGGGGGGILLFGGPNPRGVTMACARPATNTNKTMREASNKQKQNAVGYMRDMS